MNTFSFLLFSRSFGMINCHMTCSLRHSTSCALWHVATSCILTRCHILCPDTLPRLVSWHVATSCVLTRCHILCPDTLPRLVSSDTLPRLVPSLPKSKAKRQLLMKHAMNTVLHGCVAPLRNWPWSGYNVCGRCSLPFLWLQIMDRNHLSIRSQANFLRGCFSVCVQSNESRELADNFDSSHHPSDKSAQAAFSVHCLALKTGTWKRNKCWPPVKIWNRHLHIQALPVDDSTACLSFHSSQTGRDWRT